MLSCLSSRVSRYRGKNRTWVVFWVCCVTSPLSFLSGCITVILKRGLIIIIQQKSITYSFLRLPFAQFSLPCFPPICHSCVYHTSIPPFITHLTPAWRPYECQRFALFIARARLWFSPFGLGSLVVLKRYVACEWVLNCLLIFISWSFTSNVHFGVWFFLSLCLFSYVSVCLSIFPCSSTNVSIFIAAFLALPLSPSRMAFVSRLLLTHLHKY